MNFKPIDEQCSDCGYPIPRKGDYWVRDPLTGKRRHICGFCWCNPGWHALDPEYRDRQMKTQYASTLGRHDQSV